MKRTAIETAKKAVVEALERMPLIKGHGAPFIPAEVRRESGLPKGEFDQAVVALLREGVIYMAEHDHAGRLTDAQREELVYGGERPTWWGGQAPVYYVTISDRRPALPLPAWAIPD